MNDMAVNLTKAKGIREAASKLALNVYANAVTTWERHYNAAIQDAVDFLAQEASKLEQQ